MRLDANPASQRLAARFLRSHMAVAGIGLVMLCIMVAYLLFTRAATVELVRVDAPMAIASGRALEGVERSLAELRGWVLIKDQRFIDGRERAWTERVEPAVAGMDALHDEVAADVQAMLVAVQERLSALKGLQQQIEDVAQTPDNIPANALLMNDLQPLLDEVYDVTSEIVALEKRVVPGTRNLPLVALADYREYLARSRSALGNLVQMGDVASEASFHEQAGAARRSLVDIQDSRDALEPEQRDVLRRLARLTARYSEQAEEIIALRKMPGWNRALMLLHERAIPQSIALTELLQALTERSGERVMTSASRLEYLNRAAILLALMCMAFLAIAARYGAHRAARHLVEPIAQLSRATQQMAAGELRGDIAVYHDDELGVLTRSFNRMRAMVAEAGRELKARDAESRAIIEFSPGAILMIDTDGCIARLNEQAASMFGYRRGDLIGQAVEVLVPDAQRGQHAGFRAGYLKHPDARPMGAGRDLLGRRKDGENIPIEIGLASVLVGSGSVTLASVVDLTEHQRTEKSLQLAVQAAETASRAKSEFLANMSHEIRTPLNGIVGMTELLRGTELTVEQLEYLDMAYQSTEQLLLVINDILDFSRIEAGKLVLEPEEFMLRDALGDTLRSLALRAVEKDLELAYRVSPEVPDCLLCDLGRLRQILVNLVGNALKFTRKGEVLVEVTTQASGTDGGDNLHFCISDTGMGIAPEQQRRIFESFTQVEGSTARSFGGSGLGLAICRQLVAMMQGRIWVDSEPGKGSRFHFTLPLRLGSGQASVVHELPDMLRGLPVLVVDDSATNRRILLDLLHSWGMSPVLANDGAEALRQLAQASGRTFGLLLLDYMMPGMDGVELARRIVQSTGGQPRPRILLLSSAGHQLGEDERMALGIERVLTKPLKPSELFDAIVGALLQTTVRSAPAVPVVTDVRSSSVLLVDDGIANQMVAKAMLEKRGHRVTIASDGQQAIELTAERCFDVILMDVQMPGLDGYDTTREIRQQEATSGFRNRIIAMTANAMKGDREKCLEAGMDDYLTKPVHASELFAAVEKTGPEAPASITGG